MRNETHTAHDREKQRRPGRTWWKVLALATAALLYVGGFFALYPSVGDATGLLALVPVVVAGALYGMRGGVVAGVLATAAGTALYASVGWNQLSPASTGITAFVFLLTGVVVGHLRDLRVKLAEQQRVIRYQAEHDHLTGLSNRQAFDKRLEDALRQSGTLRAETAIVFLDLDGFKAVNDEHGHAAGDAVLIEAAERLRAAVRAGDVVARLGGDEFMVVAPGLDGEAGAARVAEKLVEAFREPFDIDGLAVRLSVSVGVALADSGATDGMKLLHAADAAMYEAKAAGKNRYMVAAAA